ncbi:hypothetical protein [Reichenbachiella sp.]|uniref:hypothetical protein n=1 Tax=Reichenbachiella sp. TaxID=2184521 RepID=UPI0032983722
MRIDRLSGYGVKMKTITLILLLSGVLSGFNAFAQSNRTIHLVRDNGTVQDYRLTQRGAALPTEFGGGWTIEWRWLISETNYWKSHNQSKGTTVWDENNLSTTQGTSKTWSGVSESTDAGRSCYLDITGLNPSARSYIDTRIDEVAFKSAFGFKYEWRGQDTYRIWNYQWDDVIPAFCSTDGGSYNLLNYLPAGVNGVTYTFSGDGVSGNTFRPSGLSNGNHTITVNATFPNGTVTRTKSFSVTNSNVNAGSNMTVCRYDGTIDLGGSPSGGQWRRNGTTVSTNMSVSSLRGSYTMNYQYTNNGCTQSDSKTLYVIDANPNAITDDANLCVGESANLSTSLGTNYLRGTTTYKWTPSTALSNRNISNPVASPTSTIFYEVEVSNSGCDFTDGVTVNVSTPSGSGVTDNSVEVCVGNGVQLEAYGGTAYSWSPNSNITGRNTATPTVSPSSDRTYTVNVTHSGGCIKSYTVDVDVNSLPDPKIFYEGIEVASNGSVNYCSGEEAGFQAIDNNNLGGLSYSWFPGVGLNNSSVSNPTFITGAGDPSYTVTITSGDGCQNSETINLVEENIGSTSITADQVICLGENVNLSVTGGSTYTWYPSTGLDRIDVANVVASPTTSTNYTVRIGNGGDCFVEEEVFVAVQSGSTGAVTNDAFEICEGEAVGLEATGGISYTWTPNQNITGRNTATPTVNPTDTKTYTVEVGYANDWSSFHEVGVDVNPAPVLRMYNNSTFVANNGNIDYCEGIAKDGIAVTGGSTYEWFDENGLKVGINNPFVSNPVFTIVGDTYFEVVGTSSKGCQSTARLYFQEVTMGATSISADNTSLCIGESAVLTATGGDKYTWFPSTGLSNSQSPTPIATPVTTTAYSVQIENLSTGCYVTEQVTINVNYPANGDVTLNEYTICIGESQQLEATGGDTYDWFPNVDIDDATISNPTVTPLEDRTYKVTIGYANGCSEVKEVEVNVADMGNIKTTVNGLVTGATTICENTDVQLSVENIYAQFYDWNPKVGLTAYDISNPVVNLASDQIYTVDVTDINGCIKQTTIDLTVESALVVDAGGILELCLNDGSYDLRQDVSVIGGTFTTASSGLDGVLFDADRAGVGIHFVTYEINIGTCIANDTREIRVLDYPDANAGDDVEICPGEGVQLQATGGSNYSWYPVEGLSNPLVANPIASPSVDRTYTVTVSNVNGCVDTDKIKVTVNKIEGDAGENQTICLGESIELSASGGSSYHWSPAVTLHDPDVQRPVATPGITTDYTVLITNSKGCTKEDDVTITVKDPGELNLFGPLELCEEHGYFDLRTVSNISDVVFSGDGVFNDVLLDTYDLTAGGIYFLEGTAVVNGCTITNTLEVRIKANQSVSISEDIEVCKGESVRLTVGGGSSWSWDNESTLDDPFSATPLATPVLDNTVYTVTVMDAGGCEFDKQVTVSFKEVTSSITQNQIICRGEAVELEVDINGSINSVYWTPISGLSNPNISTPSATPEETTTYTATITNEDGCTAQEQVVVTVRDTESFDLGSPIELCANYGEYDLRSNSTLPNVTFDGQGVEGVIVDTDRLSPGNIYFINGMVEVDGCTLYDQLEIRIIEESTVIVSDDIEICEGESVGLYAIGGVSYLWNNEASLSDPTSSSPTASPTVSTLYNVQVTDSKGCITSEDIEVNIDENSSSISDNVVICKGEEVELEASMDGVSIDYTWSPELGLDNNLIDTPMASPDVTTDYQVEMTDSRGCSVIEDVKVTVRDQGVLDLGTRLELCENYGLFDLRTISSHYDAKFSGTGVANELILDTNDLEVGLVYFITGTVQVNGCSLTDVLEVELKGLEEIEIDNTKEICDGETVRLSVTGGVTYLWNHAETMDDATSSRPFVTPTEPTEYTVTVVDIFGCTQEKSVQVNFKNYAYDISSSKTICRGESVILEADLDVDNAWYEWTPNENIVNRFSATPEVEPETTTTYTVTMYDINGCPTQADVLVSVIDKGVLNLGADISVCENDESFDLRSLSNIPTVTFDGYGVVGDLMLNPSGMRANQVYFIKGTAVVDECVLTDELEVFVKGEEEIFVNDEVVVCEGDSVQFEIIGGTSYEWVNHKNTINNDTLANAKAKPVSNSVYEVNVTDISGCIVEKSVSVNFKELDTEVSINQVICHGEQVRLSADLDGNDVLYEWSPNYAIENPYKDDPFVYPNVDTTYHVRMIDSDGCVAEDSVRVFVTTIPTFDVGAKIEKCESDELFDLRDVTGSTITNIYGDGVDGVIFDPQSVDPGIHFVSYEKMIGSCSRVETREVEIRQTPSPVILNEPDIVICPEDEIQLFGTGGISYRWTPSIISPADPEYFVADPVVKPSRSLLYNLTVSDGLCEGSTSIEIQVDNPTTEAGANFDICVYGTPVELESPVEGGTWEGTGIINGLFNPGSAGVGDHWAYYFKANERGCLAVDSIRINVLDEPDLMIGSRLEMCSADQPVNLTDDTNILGGRYQGEGVDGIFFDPEGRNGSHIVSYVLDFKGCEIRAYREIYVYEETAVDFGINLELCIDATPYNLLNDVDVSGGTFSGPGVVENSFDPSIVGVGNYIISYSIENAFGCITEVSKVVSVVSEIEIDAGPNQSVCNTATSIDLTFGARPATGLFVNRNVVDGIFNAKGLKAGAYVVDYFFENGNGCVSYDSLIITVFKSDIQNFGLDTLICLGDEPLKLNFNEELANGGKWSGTGVINNYFYNQLAGAGNHILRYTNDGLECEVAGSRTVTVVTAPDPAFTDKSEYDGCVGNFVEMTANLPDNTINSSARIGWYKEENQEGGDPISYGNILNYEIIGNEKIYYKSISQFGCPSDQETYIRININNPVGDIVTDIDSAKVGEAVVFDVDNIDNVEAVYWEFGDGLSSYEEKAVHYYYETGYKNISAVLSNSSSCETRLVLESFMIWDDVPILAVNKVGNEIKYYPNPVEDVVYFNGVKKDDSVRVFDLSGNSLEVSREQIDFETIELRFIDSVHGIVLVKINDEVFKVIKQ